MVPILTQEEIDALLHGPSEDECDRDNFYTRVRAKFLRLAKRPGYAKAKQKNFLTLLSFDSIQFYPLGILKRGRAFSFGRSCW